MKIREEILAAEAQMAVHRGVPAGVLRVGCSTDIARDLLADHIGEFLEDYPELNLRLKVAERQVPQPTELDVVLHAGWLADSRLLAHKIVDLPTLLVASAEYRARLGLPRQAADLADHPVIGNFYLEATANKEGQLPARVPALELAKEGERYIVPIWPRFSSTDHTMMLRMVEQGRAIAPIAAHHVLERLRSGELLRVLPDYEIGDQSALYAVTNERISISPKIRVFIDFVKDLVDRRYRDLTTV